MKILHTADWHLGDRLKHIDRSGDLRRSVEQIAGYCLQERVDVLLIAGDVFSDLAGADSLRASVAHLSQVFQPFLARGATIAAIAGNHDSDVFCETLRHAFRLAAPRRPRAGDLLPGGRLYLAARPAHFRLADRRSLEVQFVCLPYPTASRYLHQRQPQYRGVEEKQRLLRSALAGRLRQIRDRLRPGAPSVLCAHVLVENAAWPGLFRIGENEDVLIRGADLLSGWSYVALGHLHRPQQAPDPARARYAGSIERLNMSDACDQKSVVLAEIGPRGLCADPVRLPLDATPFYDIRITDAARQLPRIRDEHPQAARALVRCRVEYRPGKDDLPGILAELSRVFPRCYERTWRAVAGRAGPARPRPLGRPDPSYEQGAAGPGLQMENLADLVLSHLRSHVPDGDADKQELLELARQLLDEAS